MLESFHRGAIAIARADGSLVHRLGDVDLPVYPRSAIKLIQALPLVESGAADELDPQALALACGSHGGEPSHVNLVREWLERIGCDETDLVCGPHPPSHAESADVLRRAGREPSPLHNNCSGKHAGFAMLARHLGTKLDYDRVSHPVQRAVQSALEDLSSWPATKIAPGLDGCGVPNYALPLRNLAIAFARIARPNGLAPIRKVSIDRLREACLAHPFYVAGTGRLCTRLMQEARGVFAKVGAEGVYVAALMGPGLGVAMKIDGGARDAVERLLVALLVALGALPPGHAFVRGILVSEVSNSQGAPAARWWANNAAFGAALGGDAERHLQAAEGQATDIAVPSA